VRTAMAWSSSLGSRMSRAGDVGIPGHDQDPVLILILTGAPECYFGKTETLAEKVH
jgi:hypothetical protein